MSTYEWHITVRRKDDYGGLAASYPATIIAATRSEVTAKMRAAFEAKYDDFRKFWSHDWVLTEVREVATLDDDAI